MASKFKNITIFSLEGTLRQFSGSMLELNAQITRDEWLHIVRESLIHLAFLNSLKRVAFPLLDEKWTRNDEYFRAALQRSVSRMRNLEPLVLARIEGEFPERNLAGLEAAYAERMREGAGSVNQLIAQVRAEQGAAGISMVPVTSL